MATHGGMVGGVALGVEYPRELDPALSGWSQEGLPMGWRVMEMMYKSGPCMGKTYVRFCSPHKKDNVCTLRLANYRAALYRGASEAQAEKEADEFQASYEIMKQQRRLERGARKREASEGAETASALVARPKEEADKSGQPGNVIKGEAPDKAEAEASAEVKVEVPAKAKATAPAEVKVEAPAKAKATAKVKSEAEASAKAKARAEAKPEPKDGPKSPSKASEVKHESPDELAAKKRRSAISHPAEASKATPESPDEPSAKKRRMAVTTDCYEEHPSLALHLLPVGGGAAAEAAPSKAVDELRAPAAKIHKLMEARGFKASTQLVALHGVSPGYKFVDDVSGVYRSLGEDINGRPSFQKVLVTDAGKLICDGLYIYWSSESAHWRIGTLNERLVPLGYTAGNGDMHTDPGLRWHLLKEEFLTGMGGGR